MFQLGRAILSVSLVIIIVNHVRNFLLADTISRSDWVGKINVRTDLGDNEPTRRTPASSQQHLVSSQPTQLEVGPIERTMPQSEPGSVPLSQYTVQSHGDETPTISTPQPAEPVSVSLAEPTDAESAKAGANVGLAAPPELAKLPISISPDSPAAEGENSRRRKPRRSSSQVGLQDRFSLRRYDLDSLRRSRPAHLLLN